MLFIEFNLFCQYCSSLLYKSLRGNFDSNSTCFLQNLGSNQNGISIIGTFHSEKKHFRLELKSFSWTFYFEIFKFYNRFQIPSPIIYTYYWSSSRQGFLFNIMFCFNLRLIKLGSALFCTFTILRTLITETLGTKKVTKSCTKHVRQI